MKTTLGTLLGLGSLAITAVAAGAWRAAQHPQSVAGPLPEDVAHVAQVLGALHLAAQHPVQSDSESVVIDRSFGLSAATTARDQLQSPISGFRDDCSGYVSAVMTEEGLFMDGRVITIYERAVENDAVHWDLEPIAGDLVFFDDSHDRNHNGVLDDDLTHIGIVLDVEPDGTVVFGHAGLSTGRGVGRLNLYTPGQATNADGERINSTLRNRGLWDPPGTVYLAGELFAGFARIDPELDWTTDP